MEVSNTAVNTNSLVTTNPTPLDTEKGFAFQCKRLVKNIGSAIKYFFNLITFKKQRDSRKEAKLEERKIKDIGYYHKDLTTQVNDIKLAINQTLSIENKDNIKPESLMQDCKLFTAEDYIQQPGFTATAEEAETVYQLILAEAVLEIQAEYIDKGKVDLKSFQKENNKNKIDLFNFLIKNKISKLEDSGYENSDLIDQLNEKVSEKSSISAPKDELQISEIQKLTGKARADFIKNEAVKSVAREYARTGHHAYSIKTIIAKSLEEKPSIFTIGVNRIKKLFTRKTKQVSTV